MSILTVKVIKPHDGIQQGATLRFAENPVIRQMIKDGYYQLVKTEAEPKTKTAEGAAGNGIGKSVKNIINKLRK